MFNMRHFDRSKVVPMMTRQQHLDKIKQFQDAQDELEKRCKELGLPVPVMVC